MFNFTTTPKFCINLNRRPERWDKVSVEFAKHGLIVTRWPAVDGECVTVPPDCRKLSEHNANSLYACVLSHKAVIQHAKNKDMPYVVLFEDDVVLSTHFSKRIKHIEESKVGFDLFYLGGHDFETMELKAPNIYRIQKCGGTYAYVLHNTLYDYVLATASYQWGMDEYYDYCVQKNFVTLAHVPLLVGTEPNYSDIAGHDVDYKVKEVD